IRRANGGALERLLTVAGRGHVVTPHGQELLQPLARGGLVVDDQDAMVLHVIRMSEALRRYSRRLGRRARGARLGPRARRRGGEPPGRAALEASVSPGGLLLMTSRYRGARAWRGPAASPDFATIGPSIRGAPGARLGDHRGRARSTSSRHDSPASPRPTVVRD